MEILTVDQASEAGMPEQFTCLTCKGKSQESEAYGDCATCDSYGVIPNLAHPGNWED